MTATGRPRVAVMTFVHERDRDLAIDMLESLARSSPQADLDVYLVDDASPSRTGDAVAEWCVDHGYEVHCLRHDEHTGYRGAIQRTLELLTVVAGSTEPYDFVLRIDSDALVVRDHLIEFLQQHCTDRRGMYGVTRRMRRKDAAALLLDLLPAGLMRTEQDGVVGHDYSLRRTRPVWWWRIGLRSFAKGFRFRFADGPCVVLGSDVPRMLLQSGDLARHRPDRHGLITSEEDVIVSMICRANGVHHTGLETFEPSWAQMNWIGAGVLDAPTDAVPFVVHPLKPTPEGLELRRRIHKTLPFFVDS
ncbi:MAG: glycosyltransferase family A protein [Actinomycetota bacterium]